MGSVCSSVCGRASVDGINVVITSAITGDVLAELSGVPAHTPLRVLLASLPEPPQSSYYQFLLPGGGGSILGRGQVISTLLSGKGNADRLDDADRLEIAVVLVPQQGSHGWRIRAATTRSGWAWDVHQLEFVCASGERLDGRFEEMFYSGSAGDPAHGSIPGFEPRNALDIWRGGLWGGRRGVDQTYFLGLKVARPEMVTRIQLVQGDMNGADDIDVECLDERGQWRLVSRVHIGNLGHVGVQRIDLYPQGGICPRPGEEPEIAALWRA